MKIIILGDGLLGTEIRKQTNWDFISRKIHGFDFITSSFKCLDEYDVILNCIANTNTYGGDLEDHFVVNCDRVLSLVDYCNYNGKKLIHISTDYLYTHSIEDAKETDKCIPLETAYGYSKFAGDFVVSNYCKKHLIIRTSFKVSPFQFPKAVYQIGNFDYVDVISTLIIQLIEKEAEGIFNVGTKKKSMLELADRTRKDVFLGSSNNPKMPTNISMDISKMKEFLK